MKILIITSNVGKTAPGIVYEKIIQGLSKFHSIDILTVNYSPSNCITQINEITTIPKQIIHPRISKLLIALLGVDPFDIIWARKAERTFAKKSKNQYDIVYSFLSNHNYSAIIAGLYISKKISSKFAVHTVDAVPNPIGWVKKDLHYKGLLRFTRTYFKHIDALFSTNEQMLSYQLNTFNPTKKIHTNIIYNSGLENPLSFPIEDDDSFNFIYTGGLYGARKPDYIISAFKLLLNDFPNCNLIFVGSVLSDKQISSIDNSNKDRIKVVPYTKNLHPFYQIATALIDIDADIKNDVFISSKLPVYLMINRWIICETSDDSPTKSLFKNINSIIQCNHSSEQLYRAMKICILQRNRVAFEDRKEIIELFKIDNIIKTLNNSLLQLNSHRQDS